MNTQPPPTSLPVLGTYICSLDIAQPEAPNTCNSHCRDWLPEDTTDSLASLTVSSLQHFPLKTLVYARQLSVGIYSAMIYWCLFNRISIKLLNRRYTLYFLQFFIKTQNLRRFLQIPVYLGRYRSLPTYLPAYLPTYLPPKSR